MAAITPNDLDDRLNKWLADVQPELAEFTQALWAEMGLRITGPVAAEMVSSGVVPDGIEQLWEEQYAKYIDGVLSESWADTMQAGVSNLPDQWQLLTPENIQAWMDKRGPALFDNLTRQQSDSLNHMIRFFASEAPVSQTTLATIIKPAVGLTGRQSNALIAQYKALKEAGADESTIRDAINARSAKLQASRATLIARTELASAYNGGVDVAIQQGIDDEVFDGDIEKVWRTQMDERVCVICGPLDGATADMGEDFNSLSFSGPIPPAHPQCRCVVLYGERE